MLRVDTSSLILKHKKTNQDSLWSSMPRGHSVDLILIKTLKMHSFSSHFISNRISKNVEIGQRWGLPSSRMDRGCRVADSGRWGLAECERNKCTSILTMASRCTRLVAEQVEQQRQRRNPYVLPSSRGRRRAVRTRHQRVGDIHATFHTRGRRRRTNEIANAKLCSVLYASWTQGAASARSGAWQLH